MSPRKRRIIISEMKKLSKLEKDSSWLMVTTVPGIEDVVLKETSEKLNLLESQLKFGGVGGRVSLRIPKSDIRRLFEMRSIEHIIQIIEIFSVKKTKIGLDEIYDEVFRLAIPLGSTFRVTCERIGSHDYTSIDIQRVAGQAIVDKYGAKVNLKNPETIVRVDVVHDSCIVGVQLTRNSLRVRYPRVFQHPSALNPVIAYSMLRYSEVQPGDRVLDAFCGGGTIVIEAAQVWRNLEVIGLDISSKSIDGARRNSEAAKVETKVKFIVGDAARLEKFLPKGWKVDKAVSNLPFGKRSGRLKSLPRIYSGFLRSLRPFLNESSKVCLLTIRKDLLKSIGEKSGYKLLGSKQIMHGGLAAYIMLFKRS